MKRTHEYFMDMAIKLSIKAKGRTSPNPYVGALLVKNGRVISTGYHQKAGMPHAEIIALDSASKHASGATLYVTLEPCTHYGRTPPCIDRILQSGIKEVVVGMIDPNPVNNGKGIALLRQNNIKVTSGVREAVIRKTNEVFIKYITKKIPFITVKIAQSLDGKIATRTGESKWITSDRSRAYSHRIRQYYDGIMVGVNTVLRDNPNLNAWFSEHHPVKIVVDSQLSTPENAQIFCTHNKVIIATLPSALGQEIENRHILAQKADILEVKEKSGQINLKDMMKKLAQKEITNIIVEGGGTLIGSLFDEGLVDKVLFFISPSIIGGKEALTSVMGKGIDRIDKVLRLKDIKIRRINEDILLEGYV